MCGPQHMVSPIAKLSFALVLGAKGYLERGQGGHFLHFGKEYLIKIWTAIWKWTRELFVARHI